MPTSPALVSGYKDGTVVGHWRFRRKGGRLQFLNLGVDPKIQQHTDAGCEDTPCSSAEYGQLACPYRDTQWRDYESARIEAFDLADLRLVLTLAHRGGDYTSGVIIEFDDKRVLGLKVAA